MNSISSPKSRLRSMKSFGSLKLASSHGEDSFNEPRKPSNWRLEKAKLRNSSKSTMDLKAQYQLSELKNLEDARVRADNAHSTTTDIEYLEKTLKHMESNGPPKIPLPPLPNSDAGATQLVVGNGNYQFKLASKSLGNQIEELSSNIEKEKVIKLLEKDLESIVDDYENLKKLSNRRSPRRMKMKRLSAHSSDDFEIESEELEWRDEKVASLLKQHSRLISVLSDCSSKRSSLISTTTPRNSIGLNKSISNDDRDKTVWKRAQLESDAEEEVLIR